MDDQRASSEADLLADLKHFWSLERRFFSERGKEERERWVVGEFLSHLPITFGISELRSQPQQSNVDVKFRNAQFQVKEIPEANLRRGDEIKVQYGRIMSAKTLQETVGPNNASDVPPVVSGYELVQAEARRLAEEISSFTSLAREPLLLLQTRQGLRNWPYSVGAPFHVSLVIERWFSTPLLTRPLSCNSVIAANDSVEKGAGISARCYNDYSNSWVKKRRWRRHCDARASFTKLLVLWVGDESGLVISASARGPHFVSRCGRHR
jgi:hypothetical protein